MIIDVIKKGVRPTSRVANDFSEPKVSRSTAIPVAASAVPDDDFGSHINRADELFKAYKDQHARRRGRKFVNILAASILTHTLIALTVAYVPAVRNAFEMMTMFAGADVVDDAYRKSQINAQRDDLEVVAVVNANELFQYPDGYFLPYHGTQMTPEMTTASQAGQFVLAPLPDAAAPDAQVISSAPASAYNPFAMGSAAPATEPFPSATPEPKRNSRALAANKSRSNRKANANTNANLNTNAEVASVAASSSSNTISDATTSNANSNDALANASDASETEVNQVRGEYGFPKINARPFKDLLAQGKTLADAGKIDVKGDFQMELEAVRQDDGKLKDVKILRSSGTPETEKLALDFIAALSDSNVLARLKGMTKLNVMVGVDKERVMTAIKSDMESADEAKKISDAMNFLLGVAILKREGGDEAVAIYKKIKLKNQNNQVLVNFDMPRAEAGTMINGQLAKQ